MKKDKLLQELKDFLNKSGKADYASSNSKNWKKEKNSSTTISFELNGWKFDDNFFGGEPYGGRTIVSFKGKPVWIFIYYGWIEPFVKNVQKVYDFLKTALNADPNDKIFRGPKEYKKGNLEYKNSWQGNLERFFGEEMILEKDEEVYIAKYMGGLVDQRKDKETQ